MFLINSVLAVLHRLEMTVRESCDGTGFFRSLEIMELSSQRGQVASK